MQHVLSVYPVCAWYVLSMYPVCTQYVLNVHTLCTQHVLSVYPMCAQYVPACTQCAHTVCSACTQCVHCVHSRYSACTQCVPCVCTVCTQQVLTLAPCPAAVPIVLSEVWPVERWLGTCRRIVWRHCPLCVEHPVGQVDIHYKTSITHRHCIMQHQSPGDITW